MGYPTDSPLSITSSIAGILTFVVAIAAAVYVRLTYLRNADQEFFDVKASLSWYKTESTWMEELLNAGDGLKTPSGSLMEREMYVFVMDQLGKLEERLLALLTETEDKASNDETSSKWTLVPRSLVFPSAIAIAWLPVRRKALELVKQRDALGSRILFAQMSLISSRVRDQEQRQKRVDTFQTERLDHLELIISAQNEKLDSLEDLVYRLMHRSRISSNGQLTPSDTNPSKRDLETDVTDVGTFIVGNGSVNGQRLDPSISQDYENTLGPLLFQNQNNSTPRLIRP